MGGFAGRRIQHVAGLETLTRRPRITEQRWFLNVQQGGECPVVATGGNVLGEKKQSRKSAKRTGIDGKNLQKNKGERNC